MHHFDEFNKNDYKNRRLTPFCFRQIVGVKISNIEKSHTKRLEIRVAMIIV